MPVVNGMHGDKNCTKKKTIFPGIVTGDWEREVWILGKVKTPARPAADLQVGDRRPKTGRKGSTE